MNFFLRSIPIVLLLGTAASYAAAPIGTGTVKATTLNVRARATLQREVIAQVKRGSEVTILEAVDGWLRIVPPAGTVAWIPARALNGSTVTTKAIVYAGPGMLFSAIATLKTRRHCEGPQQAVRRLGADRTARRNGGVGLRTVYRRRHAHDTHRDRHAEYRTAHRDQHSASRTTGGTGCSPHSKTHRKPAHTATGAPG